MEDTVDLPLKVKEHLLYLAAKLPVAARSQFIKNTTERLKELALQHPNTLVYAAAGWLLGELLDNIFTINVPFSDAILALTADKASDVGLLSGALFGLYTDVHKQNERQKVARIVGEELRRAAVP